MSLALLLSLALCVEDKCSNDPRGVWGDEAGTFDGEFDQRSCPDANLPCIPPGQERCYHVERNDGARLNLCEWARLGVDKQTGGGKWVHHAPAEMFLPYKTSDDGFPRLGQTYTYRIRACAGALCSNWSVQVEFIGVPYMCSELAGNIGKKVPCYPGQGGS